MAVSHLSPVITHKGILAFWKVLTASGRSSYKTSSIIEHPSMVILFSIYFCS